MLFSEPKIPQSAQSFAAPARARVSVLFSEPKIPQCQQHSDAHCLQAGFSALQRAENSSIRRGITILQRDLYGFSALQRAENSSILLQHRQRQFCGVFQCSSASRKFLNTTERSSDGNGYIVVSVLFSEPKIPQSYRRSAELGTGKFQCSSASRKFLNAAFVDRAQPLNVAFQCSSASRKFLNFPPEHRRRSVHSVVSVLFSEPKIPQFGDFSERGDGDGFQCSSASRKFLNRRCRIRSRASGAFQCSSASRKFLNCAAGGLGGRSDASFSALQRAENSSIASAITPSSWQPSFQCSSASRKFLNAQLMSHGAVCERASRCSSASRKFLNAQSVCLAGVRG